MEKSDEECVPSNCGEGGRTTSKVALFTSLVAFISSTITFGSSSMDNASSMQVFQLMDEHAMAAPVGGTNEDGDGRIGRGTLGLVVEHEYCSTVGLGGHLPLGW
jgi:hypothetical protein